MPKPRSTSGAAGGPVRPRDVVRAAREAGYSRRTLYRARRALEGHVIDVGAGPRDPDNRWGDIVSVKMGISG